MNREDATTPRGNTKRIRPQIAQMSQTGLGPTLRNLQNLWMFFSSRSSLASWRLGGFTFFAIQAA